ncbi:MAG: EutN/CcmL family microcompartment protein [candidate division Zixibacteria bacterium]|nr:EutN/CcmL family microcompartment protein [candidate division Zixibacteria bacterium]
MKLGYVAGTLWNGSQHHDLDGCKLLIVRHVDARLEPTEDYAVCIDAVGAGEGEWVITVGGSSARLTDTTQNAPADQAIIGIVDQIDIPDR